MHDEPRQQLCQLIAQYGRTLSEDPRRCSALLKDHCGKYKREIFVLVNALENRVATELINASAGVPVAILLSRLTKRLEDELGLAEAAAKWAVETWALALGVINQPLPVSVLTPTQPVSPVKHGSSTTTVYSPSPSTGGRLQFPNFSVGQVSIGGKGQSAMGEIDVAKGQIVAIKISDDVTDFSFLETCDPDRLIRNLNLSQCGNFNDSKLVHLKKLNNLQFLDLSECNGIFGNDTKSWMSLKILKNLISFNLSGCIHISDNTLNYISENIQVLNLNMSKGMYGILGNIFITDDGLISIQKLSNLKSLDLSKCMKITGPGVLTHIGRMTQLESLNLTGCENVSAARLQELKQMLPNTRILP